MGGELSVRKTLGILLIVLFSALVTIDPSRTRKTKAPYWLLLSLGAFFCWGFLSLVSKWLALQGLSTIVFLTYLYIIVSILIVTESFVLRVKTKILIDFWPYFLAIGLFSTVFNYFNFYSVSIAPNVGYVNAINASSISLVTVFSVLLFKDEFSLRKMTGVIGVITGLLILII